jgi:hypothetical protein
MMIWKTFVFATSEPQGDETKITLVLTQLVATSLVIRFLWNNG